jgi:MOSC domain-containing protein YiiM
MTLTPLSEEQVAAFLPEVAASPLDLGSLEMIVARPGKGQRKVLEQVALSVAGGMAGDRWQTKADEDPDRYGQLTMMNSRLLKFVAQEETQMPLAGDNLVVDLELSETNMPTGQRFRIGEVELEVTPRAHMGCKQFAQRYGQDALRVINHKSRRHLKLRGIYVRVMKGGTIHKGDRIEKI